MVTDWNIWLSNINRINELRLTPREAVLACTTWNALSGVGNLWYDPGLIYDMSVKPGLYEQKCSIHFIFFALRYPLLRLENNVTPLGW